jgi:ABC-type nickel/cobalt efflux system permease component RcnA
MFLATHAFTFEMSAGTSLVVEIAVGMIWIACNVIKSNAKEENDRFISRLMI